MSNFVNTVDVVGDEALTKSIIDRSITEIKDSNTTSIGDYAFYSCTQLAAAEFPTATSIGYYAFNTCSGLTTAYFPAATEIGSYAFESCKSLTTAYFPAATSIGDRAFISCSALTTADFSSATSIGQYAFSYVKLTTAYFPAAKSIGDRAFISCPALTTADFPAVTSIGPNAFQSSTKLTALILRSERMASTRNTYVLSSTPIASGTGYIYVPRALLSDTDETKDYRRATNWSVYAAQFRALEDYTVDGTTTGALDPNKI